MKSFFSVLILASSLASPSIFGQTMGKNIMRELRSLPEVFVGRLPKKIAHTRIEKDQIAMLSCVRKLIQRQVGGAESPQLAQSLIVSAMDGSRLSENTAVIKNAHSSCLKTISDLGKDKKIKKEELKLKIEELLTSSEAEQKAKTTVRDFYHRGNKKCQFSEIGVTAAGLLGVGAGVGTIKCLRTDGKIVRYVGAKLSATIGVGAIVNITNTDDPLNFDATTTGEVGAAYLTQTGAGAILVGAQWPGTLGADASGVVLGLGIIDSYGAGLAFRVFNVGERWNLILEQLNK